MRGFLDCGNQPNAQNIDDFTEKAHSAWLAASAAQKDNGALLEAAMTRFGFEIYPYECWHFDFHGWESYP